MASENTDTDDGVRMLLMALLEREGGLEVSSLADFRRTSEVGNASMLADITQLALQRNAVQALQRQ